MSSKKKIILVVLGVLLAIAIAFVVAACVIMVMVFDSKPFDAKHEAPNPADLASAVGKLTASLGDADDPLKSLASIFSGKDARIELIPKELNALVSSGIASRKAMTGGSETLPNVKFEDACFKVEYPAKMPFSTPFGDYVNIYVEAIPKIENKNLTVKILKAKIGSLSIPADTVTEIANKEISKKDSDKDYKQMMEVIKEIYVENGNMIIVYDKKALAMMFMEKANISDMIQ